MLAGNHEIKALEKLFVRDFTGSGPMGIRHEQGQYQVPRIVQECLVKVQMRNFFRCKSKVRFRFAPFAWSRANQEILSGRFQFFDYPYSHLILNLLFLDRAHHSS